MMYQINGEAIGFDILKSLFFEGTEISLSDKTRQQVGDCRAFLEKKLAKDGDSYYGINTGFGSLYNITISETAIESLQENLIQSHACGLGPKVEEELCRLTLLLKIINLSWGHSGVRIDLLDRLVAFYQRRITPVMYTFGSLGASGDLAPLAHMSLPLIGKGEVYYKGEVKAASNVLREENLEPLVLKSKEGLALINGTQFTTALTAWSVLQAEQLWQAANLCCAASLDGFDCSISPFDERIHLIRKQSGQVRAAAGIRRWLAGSEILANLKKHVQDPYAFRCAPQVHGASYQAIAHARQIVETEINSVTDNPLLFPESDAILSGGNFHAQPIALVADYLAIALSELGSISERRIYQLVSGNRDLPDYLVEDAGLHSGFMIAQYTAASIVNRNKILSTPASVDSIISSKGQEDHVSMGANAATKLVEIVRNVWDILSIEWLVAMQALDLRKPLKSSPGISELHHNFRKQVPFLTEDRVLHHDFLTSKVFLQSIDGLQQDAFPVTDLGQ